MYRIVKQLQKKPHHVRRNVAFGTSVAVTALIALVWVSVSDFSHVAPQAGTIVFDGETQETQTASPFSALGDDVGRITESMRSLVGLLEPSDNVQVVEDSEVVQPQTSELESEVYYSFDEEE